ncbi:MAG: hypothetical protein ACRD2I_19125, partial [Vicinamibacterales bacterium]
TTEARSYGQALGKTANLGVIAAAFFKERVPVIRSDSSTGTANRAAPMPGPPAQSADQAGAAARRSEKAVDEYAATGMGRRTEHSVAQVWLDLESAPAQAVNIRYEFRPQLVKLGILPPGPSADPLQRREHAHGFEPGFCPEPPHQR